tara:strand:- start:32414 stop:33805 length:1392 start_codon:yes stop_codon:yes gene_type:complete
MYKKITSLEMKKIILCSLLMGGVFSGAFAQEKLLTKDDAISLVLEQNFGIIIAKNAIDVASNNKSLLNSGYLPTLSGASNANYNNGDRTTEFPRQFIDDPTTGLKVPVPNNELLGAESRNYGAALNLNYNLFDGLGRVFNYKKLKEQYNLTELQARETIENTIVQLFNVYYNIATLTENKEVLKEVFKVSKSRIKRTQYAFEFGQGSMLELLNAQVDATNDSINIINTEQQLKNSKRDLNVLLGQELNTFFEVDTDVIFTPQKDLLNFMETSKSANVSLLKQDTNLLINEYDIKVAKSGYLPKIGLRGSYGWNYAQSAPSAFFPGINNTNFDLGLSLNLTWNIFDGGTSSVRIKNSKIALNNQEIVKQKLELQIERDLMNALEVYQNRQAVFSIQEKNVETNQNNFDRSKEQFSLGSISSISFRQAQINLMNAQTNKNRAKYDAKLAELQLLQLTGQLLNVEF